ncbi:RimK/LysX family protein [uncultured Algimonas sp.]|uniref:ATP-dependent zinc protease family protein n=1 Tax=uncultured Algimonas sp. TaxID=1547920 RepID=UPI002620E187|nr:RimK/LysX family protein [uncultured Algimonas sp.]
MTDSPLITIGWREVVALPSLSVQSLKVKADTGAKTSALHAHNVLPVTVDGRDYVQFGVDCVSTDIWQRHVLPVHAMRSVKNSGGQIDVRYSVETVLSFGGQEHVIELTLADRTRMRYDMILGRRAMRACNMIVDPSRSYLLGKPSSTNG